MRYLRMPIEIESPEERGYASIACNLAESSMRDRVLGDLDLDLDLAGTAFLYGDHRGHPAFRGLLAAEGGVGTDQVLLTHGAAGALFIVATTLLAPGDHLVVLRPNYATNIETPRAIGCDISFVELTFERGWRYDAEDIARAMTPRTRLVSITTPHNPTGTILPADVLQAIAALVESRGAHLLVDETYRDLSDRAGQPLATALGERVISVASLSKAYGLPGLRLGWLLTRDRSLNERFLAAKEQIFICGGTLDEEIGYRVYRRRREELPRIGSERIRADAGVDVPEFYSILNSEYRTIIASTAPWSGRGTGSSRTTGTCGSDMGGRRRRSFVTAWQTSARPSQEAPRPDSRPARTFFNLDVCPPLSRRGSRRSTRSVRNWRGCRPRGSSRWTRRHSPGSRPTMTRSSPGSPARRTST